MATNRTQERLQIILAILREMTNPSTARTRGGKRIAYIVPPRGRQPWSLSGAVHDKSSEQA